MTDEERVVVRSDMPPEIITAVGMLTLIWVQIEVRLGSALAALTGARQEPVQTLLAGSSAVWRIERLRALADHTIWPFDHQLADDVDAWAKRADSVRARRNEVVHTGISRYQNAGTWHVSGGWKIRNGRLRHTSPDSPEEFEAGPFLDELVADATQLALDLEDLMDQMKPMLASARAIGLIWAHPDTFRSR